MNRSNIYISSVSEDCDSLAKEFGLGIEIAEYCTASNMDQEPDFIRDAVATHCRSTTGFVFHAPFNELCPAAIDPLVREVSRKRYVQAVQMAKTFHASKMVVHSGYIPLVYYPEWFVQNSIEFWKEFLEHVPADMTICLENVLESEPDMLVQIAQGAGDPRLQLCLDVGHANVMKKNRDVMDWVKAMRPYLSHIHMHNNDGSWDTHSEIQNGTLPMEEIMEELKQIENLTITLETIQSRASAQWLLQQL